MASAVAHQTVCWPQVYKRKPKIYCVVCGQYTKPSRQGKKLHKCIEQECKNCIHAECERLKLQQNNECDIPLEKSEDIILRNNIEETYKQGYTTDINNNKFYEESHQHRKEHKRKSLLINDKTTGDEISLVESHESNMKEKQDCKDSDINSTQHRKEHRRKSISGLENIAYPIMHTEKNESFGINATKYFEVEDLYDKAKNICDIFIKQLHYDQQYGYIGEFCEDTDIEISEADYEEPYIELLEQLYFKGHVTDRSRKKYMKKWRKHKKKRKRIFKKVKHFPTVSPKMEENEDKQDIENVIVGSNAHNKHDHPCAARHADLYNELYDEYRHSSNKPPQDESLINFVRENNERNLQPFELPQLTYIIDNTDPDEYIPPDYYFD